MQITGGVKIAAGKIGISAEEYLQNVNSGLKWCFRCKSFISRNFFWDNPRQYDGKYSQCKDCEGVDRRRRYKPVPPEERKPRSPNNQPPRDGDKKQARRSVNNKVRKGELPHARTVSCTDCGDIGSDLLHEYDHYLGYAGVNHLNVQAVCAPCHHKREKQRGNKRGRRPNH